MLRYRSCLSLDSLDRLTVRTGARGLLPAQREIVGADPSAWIRVILGGLGSGKTAGAAFCFLQHCLTNGWSPEYGEDQPVSMVLSTTVSVLRDSAARELRRITPPEILLSERSNPWSWTLQNGHKIVFKAVRSATGISASAVWLDEAHLLRSKDVFIDIQARVRDPRAASRLLVVSGVPERGWLSDVFEGSDGDPERCIVYSDTEDNVYLDPSVVAQIRKSVSATEADKYIKGRWIKPPGVVFHAYDPGANLTDLRGDPSAPVDLALDVGDQAVVLFGQLRRATFRDSRGVAYQDDALTIVDQILPRGVSCREACREAARRGWHFGPRSAIAVDPTIRRDELDGIRAELPGLKIVKRSRRGRADDVEAGYAAVNRALRDADGNVRLQITRSLGSSGGLLAALPKLRRSPSGKVHAQDKLDHPTDALRYLVQHSLPLRSGGHKVRARAR